MRYPGFFVKMAGLGSRVIVGREEHIKDRTEIVALDRDFRRVDFLEVVEF
jgi:hypothetical protein